VRERTCCFPPWFCSHGITTAIFHTPPTDLANLSLFETAGKMAAQASHATLACYKSLSRAARRDPNSAEARILRRWENEGQKKVAVQIKSEEEMMELMGVARSLGVTAEVIADAGRTQIDAGSLTVLGVGPAPEGLVNQVTGHLKLL
jgi:PTH2 family peptidyl-tRNA hydrolase